jgi:hypothetical protein
VINATSDEGFEGGVVHLQEDERGDKRQFVFALVGGSSKRVGACSRAKDHGRRIESQILTTT